MKRCCHVVVGLFLAGYGHAFTTPSPSRYPTILVRKRPFSRRFLLQESKRNDDGWMSCISADPSRTATFSGLMTFCGAALGPFLDSFHSAFGVLRYESPITATLWGTAAHPGLITAWWVPFLFGLAGFLIGWLYILLDAATENQDTNPSPPLILVGISVFTFQYWLSGALFAYGVDRTTIFAVMSAVAAGGFVALDGSLSGLIVSLATAMGGPLIEVGLLSTLQGPDAYRYLDKGETGFFPLWIVPGGPAVGNLARGIWNALSSSADTVSKDVTSPCPACNDSRAVPCPNCNGQGYYVTYGKEVKCNCCKGRGFVICRECFERYDEDPNDIETIREIMARMPD